MAQQLGPSTSLVLDELGRDLQRPECVLASPAGDVLVSDWRGGATMIHADGRQRTYLPTLAPIDLRPNGIAAAPDGSILLAHLGETGGIWKLDARGDVSPVLLDVDGVDLPPTNFVIVDARERIWISVSTRLRPRQQAWNRSVADGFVVLLDRTGARVVADGLHYTNEVRLDPAGLWLYAIETFGRRLVRFPVRADGDLGGRETVITFDHGWFPDGFAFDVDGGIWVTSLVSNRVARLHGDRLDVLVEDLNDSHVDLVEHAFQNGVMSAAHLGPIPGTRLQHVTSVAFGGPDGRTGYLGSLHGRCVYRFTSPVPGWPASPWWPMSEAG